MLAAFSVRRNAALHPSYNDTPDESVAPTTVDRTRLGRFNPANNKRNGSRVKPLPLGGCRCLRLSTAAICFPLLAARPPHPL
jgi:hypothetical protein